MRGEKTRRGGRGERRMEERVNKEKEEQEVWGRGRRKIGKRGGRKGGSEGEKGKGGREGGREEGREW